MSATTAILFQPAFGYHTPFGGDLIGSIYAPLIRLDRRFFHQTYYLSDDGIFEWAASLPISQVHPAFRSEVQKERAEATANAEREPVAAGQPATRSESK